jgi:hypothetical protein
MIKEKLKHGSASSAVLSLGSRGEKLAAGELSFFLSGFRFCRLVYAAGTGRCASHR